MGRPDSVVYMHVAEHVTLHLVIIYLVLCKVSKHHVAKHVVLQEEAAGTHVWLLVTLHLHAQI